MNFQSSFYSSEYDKIKLQICKKTCVIFMYILCENFKYFRLLCINHDKKQIELG